MHIYFHTFHILREPADAFNKYQTVIPGKGSFYITNFMSDLSLRRSEIKTVVTVFVPLYEAQDAEQKGRC